MKKDFLLFLLFSISAFKAGAQESGASTKPSIVTIPLGGNTWKNTGKSGQVGNNGITDWTDAATVYTVYIRLANTGDLQLSLHAKVPRGKSRVQVTVNGKAAEVELLGTDITRYNAGSWQIKDTGYLRISITGISREGNVFADIESIEVTGSAVTARTGFVKDNEGNFFYWGRRGPSVHLNYPLPDSIQAEWFYNEVTVPVNQDVIGSYFMAAGFAEGYFGIQVNSATERRILFSVWSPFATDDPAKIPAGQKIQLLQKGDGVHAGEFGNEGSGGQSYLQYMWKAAATYRFLLHVKPAEDKHTVYTAYFYEPVAGKWMVIAGFKRPNTSTYIKRPHSFLENFIPETGDKERSVLFSNQWIRDTAGNWTELTRARFTGDNTAVKGYRMDYGGGVNGGSFFLHNCGFFSDYTKLNSVFDRKASGKPPAIDFNFLPK